VGTRLAALGRVAVLAALAAAFVFAWFSLLWFPGPAYAQHLDHGWGLAYGHFLKTGAQAGVDYVFTYGPLGYLMVQFYVPGLFWLKYVFTALFALLEAGLAFDLMRRLPSRLLWLPFVWLVLVVLPETDTQFVLVIVMAAISCALDETDAKPRAILVAALFALLGLVKFTLFVLGIACLVVLVAFAERGKRLRAAALYFGSYVGAFLVLWIATRQSLAHIGRFLSGSLEIASGYSAAMGKQGPLPTLVTSVEVLALLLAGAALHLSERFRSRRHVTALALAAGGLLLVWKEGFVRQVPGNAVLFFGYAALFPALVLAAPRSNAGETAPLRNALFSIAWLLSIAILDDISKHPPPRSEAPGTFGIARAIAYAKAHAEIVFAPRSRDGELLRRWQKEKREWRLPAIQRRVGRATLDVVSRDQTLIFWNDFNWTPRPIMQGYAAYTPKLAAMNGDFFRRPEAPRFVLSRWGSIDGRFPAHDDGRVLIELLRDYTLALKERGYLLLERRPEGEIPKEPGRVVWKRTVAFGEKVSLPASPDTLLTVTIEAPYSAFGKLRRLAYWVPALTLQLDVAGVTEWGTSELRPEAAASEFLIHPLVVDNGTLARIYERQARPVTAFRLTAVGDAKSSYRGSAVVTLREYPAPARRGP
jgi:hypothetical protein